MKSLMIVKNSVVNCCEDFELFVLRPKKVNAQNRQPAFVMFKRAVPVLFVCISTVFSRFCLLFIDYFFVWRMFSVSLGINSTFLYLGLCVGCQITSQNFPFPHCLTKLKKRIPPSIQDEKDTMLSCFLFGFSHPKIIFSNLSFLKL